jgi:hypothetical protein
MPKMTNQERAARVDLIAKSLEEARFRYTSKWYSNIAFFENNHFVMWNTQSRVIDKIAAPPGRVMRAIPKARRQIKAMQNMILANEPRWSVIPDDLSNPQESEKLAKAINHWLQELWQKINVRKKLDTLVENALIMPVAWLKIGFDKFKDEIFVEVKDAFDVLTPFYIDADNYEDSPFIIEYMIKNIGDLEAIYGKAKTEKIMPDNRLAASDYKNYRLEEKVNNRMLNVERELQTVVVKVMFEKVKREGQKNLIKKTTVAGMNQSVFLDYEEYESNNYPFVPYSPNTGSFYQPAKIEELIPTNKGLDMFVSSIENYTDLMVKGRYQKQKGNNVSRITNETGEIVEYTTAPLEQMPLIPIPNYLFAQIQNYEKWIEESGVSTSALGKVPRGIRAYKAIESLKQSDYANLRVPVSNLADALQKMTEKIIDLAAEHYLIPRTVYRSEDEQSENFQVIGEAGAKQPINEDVMRGENPPIVIKGSYRVKCVIENGLSYTEEGKRDTLRELFQGGVISAKHLLKGFNFANVQEILDEVAAESGPSMIDCADFKILPPELQQTILQYLSQPDVALTNPLARAEVIQKKRKASRRSMRKS